MTDQQIRHLKKMAKNAAKEEFRAWLPCGDEYAVWAKYMNAANPRDILSLIKNFQFYKYKMRLLQGVDGGDHV